MTESIRQEDAITGVLARIPEILEEAVAIGSGLQDVRSIVRGDSLNFNPDTPALWVFPGEARCDHERRAIGETWHIPVTLVAVVLMTKPQEHVPRAVRIVSEAMRLIVKDRRIGLNYVQDVVKTGMVFRAQRSPDQRTGLYAASGNLKVTVNIRECD